MVIRYSIEDLLAIGEKVILRECVSRYETPIVMNPLEFQLMQLQQLQRLQSQFGNHLHIQMEADVFEPCDMSHQEPLASSVADFFKKAQQVFYPLDDSYVNAIGDGVDPRKARFLCDVEAELFSHRSD